MKHPRFLDLYHAGELPADAIEDYIADWGDDNAHVPLHVFLGMTWPEFRWWGESGQLPTEAEHHAVPNSDMVFVAFAGDLAQDLTPLRVHTPIRCRPACPIHWPSEHRMAGWRAGWDAERGIMTRLCTHDMHHPDPDDQQVRLHAELAGHVCDGCCLPTIDGEVVVRPARAITGGPA